MCESRLVVSYSLRPHGLYGLWNSPGQNTAVGSCSLLQGIFPNPGTEPRSPALQADSLPAEPPGKPRNTGVGSLSLLQQIFPTQESNQALLHCRRILYQLKYQRSPTSHSEKTMEYMIQTLESGKGKTLDTVKKISSCQG